VVLIGTSTGLAGVLVSDGAGHTATTITDGSYTISGVPAGSYTVTPSKAEYTFAPLNTPVTIGPSATGINFTGTQVTYTVSGTVALSGGTGVNTVAISDGLGHTTSTDASGNYTLSGLPAGSYTLTPSKAEYTFNPVNQAVTVGGSKTGINFTATLISYAISGRVTLSGGFAVAGATLSDGLGHTTTSDAQGYYTLSGLPLGSYTITPSKALYSAFVPANRVVPVGPSKTAMDFVGTTPLYSATGKVTSDGTTAIAGVLIVDNLGRSATTNASGNYTLSGLPAGSYTLHPIKMGLLFTPASQPLTLAANQTGINFIGATGAKLTFLPTLRK